jgi:hypothetical protein
LLDILRFPPFEIGAFNGQPLAELLSPFFEVFAETPMQLQHGCHVFDPQKPRKFNEHRKACFLVGDKGLAFAQLLAAGESVCRNARTKTACFLKAEDEIV